MEVLIRKGVATDLPFIEKIYNESVANSTATFDIHHVSFDESFLARFSHQHPLFVAEKDGCVGGYAYFVPFKDRHGYAYTKELSIYIDKPWQGKGIGSKLMEALIRSARENRICCLIGVIGESNPASEKLHKKFGFKKVAILESVGYKLGQWRSISYFQRLFPEMKSRL